MVCEYNQFGLWLDWCIKNKEKTTLKRINKEVLVEFISRLSVKQTGKLFKALAAYIEGDNYEQYLNEHTYATFVLLVNMVE